MERLEQRHNEGFLCIIWFTCVISFLLFMVLYVSETLNAEWLRSVLDLYLKKKLL